ncbi:hypothetical protein CGK40_22990, partial [Vibrio parahaemolyticus]|uniref:beta strand repeat-containing protein n=1 Tax=Vibrio parahaemolyticus TaxID=670 RepID=UPI001121EE6B
MKKLWTCFFLLCSALLLAGCNNEDKGLLATPDVPGLGSNAVSLSVTPKNSQLPIGLTQPFKAHAVLDNGSTLDVTTNAALTWRSSNPEVATVDANGLVTSVAIGSVTITAKGINDNGSTVTDSATLNVTSAALTSLVVTTEGDAEVGVGFTKPFTATAYFSDLSTRDVTDDPALSWSSSNTSVASVVTGEAAGNGRVLGVSEGVTTITASATVGGNTFTDSTALTVTEVTVIGLAIQPTVITNLPVGLSETLNAIVTLSDGRTVDVTNDPAISWASSDPEVATVTTETLDNNGEVTGINVGGPVTITATGIANGETFTASAPVTVTNSVVTSIQVTPADTTTSVGLTQSFVATAYLSDGSTINVTDDPAISWTSSAPEIATISTNAVSGNGVATGVSRGVTDIAATGVTPEGMTITGGATLTVTDASITSLVVTPTSIDDTTIAKGLTLQLTATAYLSDGSSLVVTNEPAISWRSEDPAIATVNATGLATGVNTGTTSITAAGTTSEGVPLSASTNITITDAVVTELQVTPVLGSDGEAPVGLTESFVATALLSDGLTIEVTDNPNVSWSTSPTGIADITTGLASGNGVATGLTPGVATVTATGVVNGTEFTGTTTLTVINAIPVSLAVTPETASVAKGLQQAFLATLTYSDGASDEVTDQAATSWTSNNPDITITSSLASGNGIATGNAVGNALITAGGTYGGVILSASANLDVTAAEMVSVAVTPETSSIATGRTQAFAATATMTDGTEQDITTETGTSWVSNNTSVATIDTSTGVATGVTAGGPVTMTATYGAMSGSATLTVTDAVLESITVSPTINVNVGSTSTLTATGVYSDGSTSNVTTSASWTGQDTAIATVSAGVVTGVSAGSTTTQASMINEEGVTITSAPVAISVAPFVLRICGTGVDDTDPVNAIGDCLKVATDSTGQWLTSTPSIAVMNALEYTTDNTETNDGDTYASSLTEGGFLGPAE